VVSLAVIRFVTLVLAALAMTMESAHVLELPQKMRYDARMHAAVNSTLYRWFAYVGGAYQVASIVAAVALMVLVRSRGASFGWTLAGAALLVLAFVVWLAVVQPVNVEVSGTVDGQTTVHQSAKSRHLHALGKRTPYVRYDARKDWPGHSTWKDAGDGGHRHRSGAPRPGRCRRAIAYDSLSPPL
jgi:hypothetical protein